VGVIEAEATKAKSRPVLTSRELDVLVLIAQGQTSKQIGNILDIVARTANAHAKSVVDKLGARNRAHAVAIAMRRHLLPPD
jgi:DNA-binding CsgD family transcriptional regulator